MQVGRVGGIKSRFKRATAARANFLKERPMMLKTYGVRQGLSSRGGSQPRKKEAGPVNPGRLGTFPWLPIYGFDCCWRISLRCLGPSGGAVLGLRCKPSWRRPNPLPGSC